jgi:predicted phosphohydrolase
MFFSQRNIWDPPSLAELIIITPVQLLITTLHRSIGALRSPPSPEQPKIRIVCVSDTHTLQHDIPDGDVLIHAGDLTNKGNIAELQAQIDWISSLPHQHKVAIAGNHDTYLDPRSRATLPASDRAGSLHWHDIHYLQHSTTTLLCAGRKLTLYGAPQIPKCGGRQFAFQYERERDAWTDTVPADVDVLITHTPPAYHRDLVNPSLGCAFLLREIWRVKPRLHVCGHVHAGAGRETLWWDDAQRAYEAAAARTSRGVLAQVLDVRLWADAVAVVVFGLRGLVWDRIWRGEQKRTTLVNAALMYNNTGVLGNAVQVIDI